jgi:hypothetical protein
MKNSKLLLMFPVFAFAYGLNAQTNAISSTGSVGIGTTAPASGYLLDVRGNTYVNGAVHFGSSTNPSRNYFSQGIARFTSPNDLNILDMVVSNSQIDIASNFFGGGNSIPIIVSTYTNANQVFLATNGRVGIGTANPSYKLHVDGSTFVSNLYFGSAANPSRNQLAPSFARITSPNDLNTLDMGVSDSKVNIASNFYSGGNSIPIEISSYPNAGQLFLATNGKIGIGTSSPSYKLHVDGSAYVNGGFNFGSTANPERNYLNPGFARITAPNDLNTLDISVSNSQISLANNFYSGGGTVPIVLNTYTNANQFFLATDGNVGIGTASPSHKLAVNGNIRAKKIIVETGWSDYVFDETYRLPSLSHIEAFIKKNKHLPDIPSAKEVEKNGVSVGENQALLLKKIEELTLYVIQLDKANSLQKKINRELFNDMKEMKRKLQSKK